MNIAGGAGGRDCGANPTWKMFSLFGLCELEEWLSKGRSAAAGAVRRALPSEAASVAKSKLNQGKQGRKHIQIHCVLTPAGKSLVLALKGGRKQKYCSCTWWNEGGVDLGGNRGYKYSFLYKLEKKKRKALHFMSCSVSVCDYVNLNFCLKNT